jgi:hypothetical protein
VAGAAELDGCTRSPLPRFTVLSAGERAALQAFFAEFARRALRVLVPGGHLMLAANPLAVDGDLPAADGRGL